MEEKSLLVVEPKEDTNWLFLANQDIKNNVFINIHKGVTVVSFAFFYTQALPNITKGGEVKKTYNYTLFFKVLRETLNFKL